MECFRTSSPEDTRALGEALGALLCPGHLVLLSGPLGAGKTVFVQGVAAGLGVTQRVTSPTFTLLHHYEGEGGRCLLVHADLYRLSEPGDWETLGLEDAAAQAPLVVEWWERAPEAFPPGRLEIEVKIEGESADSGWSRRSFHCRATDALHARLLEAWARAVKDRFGVR